MEALISHEAKALSGQLSALEKEAGVEVFEDYGDINILDSLSNGNPLMWDDLMATPYERIIVQLMLNKDKREYAKRYQEILRLQNESNK